MRAFPLFLLLCKCLNAVKFDPSTQICTLEAPDRLEDAIGVCKNTKLMVSNLKVTDFSGITQQQFKDLSFKKEMSFYSSYDLRMVNNSMMNDFELNEVRAKRVEIRRNCQLGDIRFRIENVTEVRVSGNPKAYMYWLKKLFENHPKVYLQEEGECEYEESVKNVTELENCKYIASDLIMENTGGTRVPSLTQIKGCLRMINTEMEDIEFLKGIKRVDEKCKSGKKSEISGNKKLWIHPFKKRELQKVVPIDITIDPSATFTCTPTETISLDFGCTHVNGDLVITKHADSLHNLKTIREINGTLKIYEIDIDSLSFPELTYIGRPDSTDPVLLVSNNLELIMIEFPKLEKAEGAVQKLISFKGNKKLKNLDSLRQQFLKFTEENSLEIECSFGGTEVSKLSQLTGCTSISGDLVLKGTVEDSTPEIKLLGGCLRVIDTSLKDLSFLNLDQNPTCTTESEISGNKDLCLPWPVVKGLTEKIGKIVYKAEPSCEILCSEKEFEEFAACNVLEGDLTITGFDSNNDNGSPSSTVLAKAKRITGKLTISGNSGANIELPNLEKIGNPSLSGEALLIEGNENLKGISTPKLKSLETSGSVPIVVKGFKMPKDQAKILKLSAGDKKFQLECDFSNKEVKDFSELEYCTDVKGDLLLKNTRGGLNSKIESIGGCLKIIDTDLTKDQILSLVSPLFSETCKSGEKSEIKGNKNLCLNWKEVKDVKNTFVKPVEFSIDESCEFSCSEAEFAEEGSFCEQFNGDLSIHGNADPNVANGIFEKLKRVKGSISIFHTLLEEIHFTHLSEIENSDPDSPAFFLSRNNALRKLSMPLLKKLASANSESVYITENDGFRMSIELKTVLEAALAPGHTRSYYCHESAEISDFSRLEGCTKMSSDVHLKGKISGNHPTTKLAYISGCLNVENTDLNSLSFLEMNETSGNLELLEGTGSGCDRENTIQNNGNLCIFPSEEGKLKEFYPNMIISNNKPKDLCPVACTAVNGKITENECNIVKGELKIEKDCSYDQSLALVREIGGGLVVKDCSMSSLMEILPKLKNISSSGIPLLLENVENYSNLKELNQIKLESDNPDGVLLKIETNQEISYMVAADLKAHFGSKRVEIANVSPIPEGVCIFVDPATEVKNCKTVEGDLVLNENSVTVSTELKEITGCLVVKNTNVENYEFLTKIEKAGGKCLWNSGETVISSNSCIPYAIRRKTSGKIAELVEKEENKKGCYECSGEFLQGQECKVIIGNLEIDQNSSPEVVKQLEEVKEIYGRLIIKGSNLPEISLTQLTKIEADSEEPAVEISGNNELSSLLMPSLNNITSNGKVLVKIQENKDLKKTPELTEKLAKATGSECGEGKGGSCQFSQAKESQKVKEPEKATATKENSTEEGVSKTLLIGLGIAAAILVIVAIVEGTVIIVLVKKRKGGKKAKKELGPGKPPKSTMSKIASKNSPSEEKTKTQSMAAEKGAKSGSDMKNASKEPVKGEESKEPANQMKEGEAPEAPVEENPQQNVPNAL